ncbi:MAG TPA: DsbA family oxidoreductase [Streptosporangiaceae bacterium]|jgi:predicted DsbA family dithiol-disulfide isomerase
MRVDIWSDVVCPWCYLGQARFEKALAGFDGRDEVEVAYHSFELDPSWPSGQTMPILEMLATKYHLTPAEAEAAEGQVGGLARAEGLPFRPDRPLGNTFDVHRVLQLARDQGFQHRLLDTTYRSYFGEAADVFDPDVLSKIAATAGLDPGDVQQVLGGDDYTDEVRADEQQAQQIGIRGVPFYVLDGRLGISGAQSAATFTEALRQAAG